MKLATHLVRLEAWLQSELTAQQRLLEHVTTQEAAIQAADDAQLARASAALEAELATQPARGRVRADLFAALGAAWGVAPRSLTIGSVIRRAEEAGLGGEFHVERLRERRDELRAMTERVAERGRRVAALARQHQDLLAQVMVVLFTDGRTGEPYGAARLVDAQG